MNRWRRAIFLLACALIPSAAGAQSPSGGERTAGWRRDLDSLVSTVRATHWLYRTGARLPVAFDEQRVRIVDSLATWNDERVVTEFQHLLATLSDGHTLLFPFAMQRGVLGRAPIAFYDFDDGLAIIAADSAHRRLIGRRVATFGTVASPGVFARLAPSLSAENAQGLRWVTPTYLTFPAFLEKAGARITADSVVFTLDSTNGERVAVAASKPVDPGSLITGLVAPPAASLSYLAHPDRTYWMARLDAGVVYCQLNRVASDSAESIDAFSARLFTVLRAEDVNGLILDLRTNSGGNAAVLPPLLRTVIAYRALRPSSAIVVLIGRQTFSAAQTLVNRIEEYARPILIGEGSGSKPNRFGNEAQFRLPYSGIRGSISSGYNQAASSRDQRLTTSPEIAVPVLLADWLAGRDRALEEALRQIRARR